MKTPIKNSIDYKFYGPEPKDYNQQALTWYTYFCDKSDYTIWLKAFIKKNKLNKEVDSYVPSSIGVSSYYLVTNRTLPKNVESRLLKYVDSLKTKVPQKTIIGTVPKLSIQDRIQEQVNNYCSVLDGVIDELIKDKYTKFDIKSFAKDIKSIQANKIKDFYLKQYNDTLINDEFTKEGYSYMTKSEFITFQNFLKSIINTMESQSMIQKASKKPRKKKETPLYKKVAKLNYMNASKEYNISSINPEKIVGSNIVIVFNTKTNTFFQLVSSSEFDIKGSTLINFNEQKSFKQKVRKPKEFLSKLQGKRSVTNAVKTLTTKPSLCTPRINKDCIIINAF